MTVTSNKPAAYRPIELVGGALFAIGVLLFLTVVYTSFFPVDERALKAASAAFGIVWITATILFWWDRRHHHNLR